jgi:hypothetical protein
VWCLGRRLVLRVEVVVAALVSVGRRSRGERVWWLLVAWSSGWLGASGWPLGSVLLAGLEQAFSRG